MEQINIRSIQHYLYCPHRWGLIEIDRAWAENYFIARAQVVHKRADSAANYSLRGKKVHTAVRVWNDEYGLYGVTDCVEEDAGGYTIVEYKPTMPKGIGFREDDAMQVFAQKVCVDQVFGCNCKAVLYYADKKKRIELPFEKEYDSYQSQLIKVLAEMRSLLESGKIPSIRKDQYCGGCSIKNVCLPEIHNERFSVYEKIVKFAGEDI